MEEVKQAAESGDVKSQHRLGVMYIHGDGLECDQVAAYGWFRLAAAQGFAPSQRNLGLCYLMGHGIKQSEDEAAKWFQIAAENGDQLAQYHLASLYEDGRGVPQDNTKAAYWYGVAADQGNAAAQYQLSRLYYFGLGVAEDSGKAWSLLHSAANQGLPYAQNSLGESLEYNDGDRRSAAVWYAKAAEQGYADAQCNLARTIRAGVPVPVACEDDADRWIREAEEHLSDSSEFPIEPYPEQFSEVTHDPTEAIKWFSKAAEQGHIRAQALLAEMLDYGEGVTQSLGKAIDLYRKAAEGGDIEAQLRLSEIYRLGRGVKVDAEEATKWLRMATDTSPWGALATGLLSRDEDSLKLAAKQLFSLHQSDDFEDLYAPFHSLQRFDAALDSVIQIGWPVALVLRGMLHFIRGRKDFVAAKHCFLQAEDADDPLAAYYLGLISLRGLVEVPNQMLASVHFEKCFKLLKHYDAVSRVIQQGRNKEEWEVQKDYYDREFEIWLLGSARSQYANIKIGLAREETHKQTLSFLTHTLNNALSTAPASARQAIRILGDLYDRSSAEYKAINNIASLHATVLFVQNLLNTFKQYVSSPEEFAAAWQRDTGGDATVPLVLALALRQSISRVVFSENHQEELKRLLPNKEVEAVKEIRKAFLVDLLSIDLTPENANEVFDWVHQHFDVIHIELQPDAEVCFKSNATRYMLFFATFSELIYNALKYSDGSAPIQLRWQKSGTGDYSFTCCNSFDYGSTHGTMGRQQEGTNKGLFFIGRLMKMLPNSELQSATQEQTFTAQLRFGHENFREVIDGGIVD